MICEVLRANGYEVIEAASPRLAEGIANGGEQSIDLLVTDVVMPEMNGHELARRLQAIKPQTRVLLMSGYSAPMLDSHGVDQGELEVLKKPFAQSVLLQRVRHLLDEATKDGAVES